MTTKAGSGTDTNRQAELTSTHQHESGAHRLAARRPATGFVTVVLSIGLPLLTLAAVINVPREPFLLLTTYVGLTVAALVITRWVVGQAAIRGHQLAQRKGA